MSITATFYTFNKKVNSTKKPTGGTSYNIVLKDSCSIVNPSILVDLGNPSPWNYVYIPYFDRYYFINDWVSDHDLWRAECTCDVLASWKNDIVSSTQFVVRAASKSNSYLQDTIYPMSTRRGFDTVEITDIFDRSSIRYILAVSNMDNTANSKINGLQYLILNKAQMLELTRVLLSEDYFGLGPTEALFGLTFPLIKSVCSPLQYIGESYILPFTPRQDDTVSVSSVNVGWWTLTGYNAASPSALSNNGGRVLYSKTITFTLNKHPQIGLTGRLFLNSAPYVDRTLYAGPFGNISLNDNIIAQMLGSNESITLNARIDVDFKGHAILYVYNADPYIIIDRRECNVAVPIPLTQSKNELYKMGDAVINGATNVMGGNLPGGLYSGIRDAVSSIVPKMQTVGSQGSFIDIFENWHLQTEFRYISEGEPAVNIDGAPLCEVVNLSTLTGFVQCSDSVWLETNSTATENEQIKNYMTGGFFIE